jgi:hypothetical protein
MLYLGYVIIALVNLNWVVAFLPAQFAHILGYVKPWAEICTTTFRGAHYEAKPSTFKLSGDKNIPK